MIRKVGMKIISIRCIAQDTFEMILENNFISNYAVPGQFLHLQVGEHSLRRPISITDCDPSRSTVTIIFKINGQGTRELSAYQVGQYLNVLGPMGNGFPLHANSTALLIGGGIGVPPLYYLGKTLREMGCTIISVLGFQDKNHVFYENEFKNLGKNFIVTNNGSYGESGLVTDVINHVHHFDYYYSCGPIPMLRAVSQELKERRGYISIEERMGCGVGACYACVVPTKDGTNYKKICKDGPVFVAGEVKL
ncbi:dihydroorotate dehydrogenase electron transfer subunit [Ornithinibacillus bavariensis]|uniref:Dihydroorotate dehydrogenase B (NAD(+)), electron transfer subunit n=1 Tax=Ornithinibacillus bavariensis TaxID=545502 RepID=A0A919X8K5_9BACI|nr:dihydroorotate dehydrogenase electron transfer subunit [Ornithinibacillus bavariensis]GIO26088.1 dihydroorotate dehydrogenase B (NAD(+)), electron transfer subunit [Ornithinibacillus bavariensis]